MKLFITTIYDHIAKVYTVPAYAGNTSIAARAFANAANDLEHAIGRNPGDYTMFILGEFDDDSAEFKIYTTPQSIGLAASYVKRQANVQLKKSPQPKRNEALVQSGAPGGNSSEQLRPESRPQDNVRRGVADTDTH